MTLEIDLIQTGDVVFAIGVALTVLIACFLVLFLLDRNRWNTSDEEDV